MANLLSYIAKQSDEELRGVIHSYCLGTVRLSADAVLAVCRTLALRDPQLPDPYELFLSLCRMYS